MQRYGFHKYISKESLGFFNEYKSKHHMLCTSFLASKRKSKKSPFCKYLNYLVKFANYSAIFKRKEVTSAHHM